MAVEREPQESESGQGGGPTKAQILIAILTTITAIASCVEHLAR